MVNELLSNVKFERSDERILLKPGILGTAGLARHYGYPEFAENNLLAYESNNAFNPDRYPMLAIYSRAAGGVGIADTELISKDLHLCRLLFPGEHKKYRTQKKKLIGEDEQKKPEDVPPEEVGERYFPKKSTMSEYYGKVPRMDGHRLRRKNREIAYRMITDRGVSNLYLDFDSKVHFSDNQKAESTYKGPTGYNPFYVTAPAQKLCLDHVFRKGNRAPQSNNKSAVRTHLKEARGAGIKRFEGTIDNAGFQVAVMKAFQRADKKKDFTAKVYCRPCKPKDQDQLKKKAIRAIGQIKEEDWKPIRQYQDNGGRKRYRILTENQAEQLYEKDEKHDRKRPQIGETTYTIANDDEEATIRMAVIRERKTKKRKDQKQLVDTYKYTPVVTNDYGSLPTRVMEKYNRRGGAEDVIGEIVEDGKADRFPCEEDEGNALYLGATAAAHNLLTQQEWLMDQMQKMDQPTVQNPEAGSNQTQLQTKKQAKQCHKTPRKTQQPTNDRECASDSTRTDGKNTTNITHVPTVVCAAFWLVSLLGECRNRVINWFPLSDAGSHEEPGRGQKREEQPEKNPPGWLALTPARFRDRMISVPVRITRGGGYKTLKIQNTSRWADLFEPHMRACCNPEKIIAQARPP